MAVSILMALGWALAYLLAGLLALLVLLLLLILFLPFDLFLRVAADLSAEAYDDPLDGVIRWQLRLRWGRWVFTGQLEGEFLEIKRADVRLCGIRPSSRPPRRPKPQRKNKRQPLPSLDLMLAGLEEVARFMARCVSDLGIRVKGQATYGFADPAVTGWCEGIRWAFTLPVPIDLTPDFSRPCLKGWAEAEGRTNGYRVAAAALGALRNPVIRQHLAKQIRFKPLRYILLRGG